MEKKEWVEPKMELATIEGGLFTYTGEETMYVES